MMKCFQLKTLCKPAITGESNKLIGLATEAEVRWVQWHHRSGLWSSFWSDHSRGLWFPSSSLLWITKPH